MDQINFISFADRLWTINSTDEENYGPENTYFYSVMCYGPDLWNKKQTYGPETSYLFHYGPEVQLLSLCRVMHRFKTKNK